MAGDRVAVDDGSFTALMTVGLSGLYQSCSHLEKSATQQKPISNHTNSAKATLVSGGSMSSAAEEGYSPYTSLDNHFHPPPKVGVSN